MTRCPPVTAQRARQQELDRIRCQRRLTADEAAEADRITAREQMRQWRAQQQEIERRLGTRR